MGTLRAMMRMMRWCRAVILDLLGWYVVDERPGIFFRKKEGHSRTEAPRSFAEEYVPSPASPTEVAIHALITERRFEEALAAAYLAYHQEIVARCTMLLHRLMSDAEAEAEEVALQVFHEFSKSLRKRKRKGRYHPSQANVRSFLHIIAGRRCIDKLRTPNRLIPGRDVDVCGIDHRKLRAAHAANPETVLLAKEERKLFQKGLKRLAKHEKHIMELSLDGFSKAKIAQLLDEKPGTIRAQFSRALGKLRKVCDVDG
jgi:RNA polymerase sigma factor (sigma-70 family)